MFFFFFLILTEFDEKYFRENVFNSRYCWESSIFKIYFYKIYLTIDSLTFILILYNVGYNNELLYFENNQW